MSNAPGQAADGVHALGLAQLGLKLRTHFFSLLAFSNIQQHDVGVQFPALRVTNDLTALLEPDDPAVFGSDPILPNIGMVGAQGMEKGLEKANIIAAKKLFAKGWTLPEVSEFTGLPEEMLIKLQTENKDSLQ